MIRTLYRKAQVRYQSFRSRLKSTNGQLSTYISDYNIEERIVLYFGIFLSGFILLFAALVVFEVFNRIFSWSIDIEKFGNPIEALFILSIFVYFLDYISGNALRFLLRDIMIRVYALYGAFVISISVTGAFIYLLEFLGFTSEEIQGTTALVAIDFVFAVLIVLVIRVLPRLKAAYMWLISSLKSSVLPPYNYEEWHLPPPFEEKAADREIVGFAGYIPINVENMEKRPLGRAIFWCSLFYFSTVVITYGIISVRSQYNNFLSAAASGTPIVEFIQGVLLAAGIPPSVVSMTIEYFGLTQEDILGVILFIVLPVILLVIPAWNFIYIYEELQYRVLRSEAKGTWEELTSLLAINASLVSLMVIVGLFGTSPKIGVITIVIISLYYIFHSTESLNLSIWDN